MIVRPEAARRRPWQSWGRSGTPSFQRKLIRFRRNGLLISHFSGRFRRARPHGAGSDHYQRDQRPAGRLLAGGRWLARLSILIGLFEAMSIDRRIQGNVPPRPLTHDLLRSAIDQLGGEAQDVVITNLVEHTYYAQIRIQKDDDVIELDARPSDAIALAVHYDTALADLCG